MLCCEVLKAAAVVLVTPLPDDLHCYCIYLFKAKMQQKQHYLSTIMVVTFHLKLSFRSSNLREVTTLGEHLLGWPKAGCGRLMIEMDA